MTSASTARIRRRTTRTRWPHIPADADQYTNCRDVLRAAQLAAASAQAAGRTGSAPVSNATVVASSLPDPLAGATPAEKAAVTEAGETGAQPVRIAGKVVEPSTLGAGRAVAAGLSDLPAPLLAALSPDRAAGARRDRLRPHPACPRPP